MFSKTSHCFRLKTCFSKGFTLIEVLVAIVIFTSMLVLAGAALNQGLRQYHGLVEKGIGFWNYTRFIWLDKSVNSLTDYYVYKRGSGWFPYFAGKYDGMSYVSLAPFAGDLPVVVWLKKETSPNGKSALKYYELPVYARTLEDIERTDVFQDYKKGNSFIILEDAENLAFSFYDCDIFRRQCQWSSHYDGSKTGRLPEFIKIEFAKEAEQKAMYFSINSRAGLKSIYNDIYSR